MSEATQRTEQIRRELAILGEAPLTEAELALIRDPADATSGDLDHDHDVASVARLAELAAPIEFEDLSQLELHRGWRGVEQRLAGATTSPNNTGAGGGGRAWLFAAIGVAAAAVVLLIVMPSNPDSQAGAPSDQELAELAALGDQARAALQVLDDGQTDTERATKLATDYQRRLAQREEQGG